MDPQYRPYIPALNAAQESGEVDGSLDADQNHLNATYNYNLDQAYSAFEGKANTDEGAVEMLSHLNKLSDNFHDARKQVTAGWLKNKAVALSQKAEKPWTGNEEDEQFAAEQIQSQAENSPEAILGRIMSKGGVADTELANPEEESARQEYLRGSRDLAAKADPTRPNNGKKVVMDLMTDQGTSIANAQAFNYDGKSYAALQFGHDKDGQPIPQYDRDGKKNQMPTRIVPIEADYVKIDKGLEAEEGNLRSEAEKLGKELEQLRGDPNQFIGEGDTGAWQVGHRLEMVKEKLAEVSQKRQVIAGPNGREELFRMAIDGAVRKDESLMAHIPRGGDISSHWVNAMGGVAIAINTQRAGLNYLAGDIEEARSIMTDNANAESGRAALGYGRAAYRGGTLDVVAQELPAEALQMVFDVAMGWLPSAAVRGGAGMVAKQLVKNVGERAIAEGAATGIANAAEASSREFVTARLMKRLGDWALPVISSIPGGMEEAAQVLRGFDDADALESQATVLQGQLDADKAQSVTTVEGEPMVVNGPALKYRQTKIDELRKLAEDKREGVAYAFYATMAATGVTDAIGLEKMLKINPKTGLDDIMFKSVAKDKLADAGAELTGEAVDKAAEETKATFMQRALEFIDQIPAMKRARDAILKGGAPEAAMEGIQSATNVAIVNQFLKENSDIISGDTFNEAMVGLAVGTLTRGLTSGVPLMTQRRVINDVAERGKAVTKQESQVEAMAKDALREQGIEGYTAAAPAEEVVKQRADGRFEIQDKADHSTAYAANGYFHGISFANKDEAMAFAEKRWKYVTEALVDDEITKNMVIPDDDGNETKNQKIRKERGDQLKAVMGTIFSSIAANQGTHSENIYAAIARTMHVGANTPIDLKAPMRPAFQEQEDLASAVMILASSPEKITDPEVAKHLETLAPSAKAHLEQRSTYVQRAKKALNHVVNRMTAAQQRARQGVTAMNLTEVGAAAAAAVPSWSPEDEAALEGDSDSIAGAMGLSADETRNLMGAGYVPGTRIPDAAREGVRARIQGQRAKSASAKAIGLAKRQKFQRRKEIIKAAGRKAMANALDQIPEPEEFAIDPGAVSPGVVDMIKTTAARIGAQRTGQQGTPLAMATSPGGEIRLFQKDNPTEEKQGGGDLVVDIEEDDVGNTNVRLNIDRIHELLNTAVESGVIPGTGGVKTPPTMRSAASVAEAFLIAGHLRKRFTATNGRDPTLEERRGLLNEAMDVVYGKPDKDGNRSQTGRVFVGKFEELVNDNSDFAPSISMELFDEGGNRINGASWKVFKSLASVKAEGNREFVLEKTAQLPPGFQGIVKLTRAARNESGNYIASTFALVSKVVDNGDGKVTVSMVPVTRYYAQIRSMLVRDAQRKALAATIAIGLTRSAAMKAQESGRMNSAEVLGMPADMVRLEYVAPVQDGEEPKATSFTDPLDALTSSPAFPLSIRRFAAAAGKALKDIGATAPEPKPYELVADYFNRMSEMIVGQLSEDATKEFAKQISSLNGDDNLTVPTDDVAILTAQQRVESQLLTMAGSGSKDQMIDALMLGPDKDNLVRIPMGQYNGKAPDGHPDRVNMKDDITAGRFMVAPAIKDEKGEYNLKTMVGVGMREAANRGKDSREFRLLRAADGEWFRKMKDKNGEWVWYRLNKGLYISNIGNEKGVFPGLKLRKAREGRLAQMALINNLDKDQDLGQVGFSNALRRFSGTTPNGYRETIGMGIYNGLKFGYVPSDSKVITRLITAAMKMREGEIEGADRARAAMGTNALVPFQRGSAKPFKRSGDPTVTDDDGEPREPESTDREEGESMDDSPMVKGSEKALWDFLRGMGQMMSVSPPEMDEVDGIDEVRMALAQAMNYMVGDRAKEAGVDLESLQADMASLWKVDEADRLVSDTREDNEKGEFDAAELGEGGGSGIVKDEKQFQTIVNMLKDSGLIPPEVQNMGEYTLELWVTGQEMPLMDGSEKPLIAKDGKKMTDDEIWSAKLALNLGTDAPEEWSPHRDDMFFQESTWGRRRITGEYNLLDPEDPIFGNPLKEGDLVLVDGIVMELVEVKKKDGLNLAKLTDPKRDLEKEHQEKMRKKEQELLSKGLGDDSRIAAPKPTVREINSLVNDTLVTSPKRALELSKKTRRVTKLISEIRERAAAKVIAGKVGIISPRLERVDEVAMAEIVELLRDELVSSAMSASGAFAGVSQIDLIPDAGGDGLADMRQKVAGSIWYANRVKPLRVGAEKFFFTELTRSDVANMKVDETFNSIMDRISDTVDPDALLPSSDSIIRVEGSEMAQMFLGTVFAQVAGALPISSRSLFSLEKYGPFIDMAEKRIIERAMDRVTGVRGRDVSHEEKTSLRTETAGFMTQVTTPLGRHQVAVWMAEAMMELQSDMLKAYQKGVISGDQFQSISKIYRSAWMQGKYDDSGTGDQSFGSIGDNLLKALMPSGWTSPSSPKNIAETDPVDDDHDTKKLKRPGYPTTGWVMVDMDGRTQTLIAQRAENQGSDADYTKLKESFIRDLTSLPAPAQGATDEKIVDAFIASMEADGKLEKLSPVAPSGADLDIKVPSKGESWVLKGKAWGIENVKSPSAEGGTTQGMDAEPAVDRDGLIKVIKNARSAFAKAGKGADAKEAWRASIEDATARSMRDVLPMKRGGRKNERAWKGGRDVEPVQSGEEGWTDPKAPSTATMRDVIGKRKGWNKGRSFLHVADILDSNDANQILNSNRDLMDAWMSVGQLREFLQRSISQDPAMAASYRQIAFDIRASVRASDTQEMPVQAPEKEELLRLALDGWFPKQAAPGKPRELVTGQAGSGLQGPRPADKRQNIPVTLYQEAGDINGQYERNAMMPHGIITLNPAKATPETFIHEMMHWLHNTRIAGGTSLLEASLGPNGYKDLMSFATKGGLMDPENFEEGSQEREDAWRFVEERIADSINMYFARGVSGVPGAKAQIVALARMVQSIWKTKRKDLQDTQKEFYSTPQGRATMKVYDELFLGSRGAFELATTDEEIDAEKMIQMVKDAHPGADFSDEEVLKIVQMAQDQMNAPALGLGKPMVKATGEGKAVDDPATMGARVPEKIKPRNKTDVKNAARAIQNKVSALYEALQGSNADEIHDSLVQMIGAERDAQALKGFAQAQRKRAQKDDYKGSALAKRMLDEADIAEARANEIESTRTLYQYEPNVSNIASGPADRSHSRLIMGEYESSTRTRQMWSAARYLVHGMTARNGGPQDMFIANLNQKRWRNQITATLTFIQDDMQKAIDRSITLATTSDRVALIYRRINEFLTARTVAEKAAAQRELTKVSNNEVAFAAFQAREFIDKLSQKLLDDGVVHGPLAAVISQNMGVYLHRTFPHIPKNGLVDRAFSPRNKAVLTQVFQDLMDSGAVDNEADAEALVRSVLDTMSVEKMKQDPLQTNGMGVPSAVLSRGIKDETLATILAPLTGMELNPMVRIAKTVSRLSEIIAKHNFQASIRDIGLEQGFVGMPDDTRFTSQVEGSPILTNEEAGENMLEALAKGPLAGFRMRPETLRWYKQVMEDDYGMRNIGPALSAMMSLNGSFKVMNTVYSWPTAMKNIISSFLHMLGNGYFRGMGDAFQLVKTIERANARDNSPTNDAQVLADRSIRDAKVEAARRTYEKLIRLGVADAGQLADIQDMFARSDDMMSGLLGGLAASASQSSVMMSGAGQKAKRAAEKFRRAHQRLYLQGDTFFKIAAFNSEVMRLTKSQPTWNADQIEQEAARRAVQVMFSFDLEPKIVRDWKRFSPLFGNFISFSVGQLRARVGSISLVLEDLREGKRRMDAGEPGGREQFNQGLGRAAALTAVATLGSQVGTSLLASLLGWDEEKRDALNEMVPEWDRDGFLLPLGDFVPGEKIAYINFATLFPDSYTTKGAELFGSLMARTIATYEAGMDDEIVVQAWRDRVVDMFKHTFGPFADQTMTTQAAFAIIAGKDQYLNNISEATADGWTQFNERLTHMARQAYVPGTLKMLARMGIGKETLAPAVFGDREMAEIEMWKRSLMPLGFSVRTIDPNTNLKMVIKDSMDGLINAKDEMGRMFKRKNKLNPDEVMADVERLMDVSRVSVDKSNKVLHAAASLGVGSRTIADNLMEAHSKTTGASLTKQTANWIWRGSMNGPINFSKQTANDITDAAEAAGDQERIPLLKALMRKGYISFSSGR